MRYTHILILAAVFLIVGMGVQTVIMYHRATFRVQERIDIEMQIAQERFQFELYDPQDAANELDDFVEADIDRPDAIMEETRLVLERYKGLTCCYIGFVPNFFPLKGELYWPLSWRQRDSLITLDFSKVSPKNNYLTRPWYKGAMASDETGYWSPSYMDQNVKEMIFTYSVKVDNRQGDIVGVVGMDVSIQWVEKLLEVVRPYDDAVCWLYTEDGFLLATSKNLNKDEQDIQAIENGHWIVSHQSLAPINLNLAIAVPRSQIWTSIRMGIVLPFSVFLLGVLVVGVLINRVLRDRKENARLELMRHELHIAHDIQMGILKGKRGKVKGERKDVDIYAELIPMKEVGGDLYDYHIEGDELWFIIGDVSGKGVPAAMFMSATVNLFRATGRRAFSPKEIVEEMNSVLSENNPSLTFVTAFIGRLHIPSGQLLYCNAGHCEPLIQSEKGKEKGERFLECEPNIPLGFDGSYEFVEQGCMLDEGETLVLYTDGVTEARNKERKMLGKQHWARIVAQGGDLMEQVKAYIGHAEPTDDITLMTIRKVDAVQPMRLRVPNHEDQWPVLKRAIQEFGLCIGMEKKTLKKLELAAEEAVVNILHYSQANEIEMVLSIQNSAFSIQLSDDGVAFDPTKHKPNEKATHERQIGGMGISLIRQIVDEIHYERANDRNVLTLVKLLNR